MTTTREHTLKSIAVAVARFERTAGTPLASGIVIGKGLAAELDAMGLTDRELGQELAGWKRAADKAAARRRAA
jgi:hypothetical protein